MSARSNGKARRSAAEWQEIVDRFHRSGLKVRKFCQQESIGEGNFHRWRTKLEAKKKPANDFVEVTPAVETESGFWSVEVELPDGRMLRIHG